MERGMGERSHVEGFYSVFKRRFGEFFWAKRIENMIQEIKFKIILCNLLILNKLLFELRDRAIKSKPLKTNKSLMVQSPIV